MSYGVNAPQGLRPVRYLNGAPWVGTLNAYPIASGYNTAIYTQDPVISLSDGTIGIGVAGSAYRGVFMGVKYNDSTNYPKFMPYWAASTATYGSAQATALILDDPNMVFDIQESASSPPGTPLALADRNLNANFAVAAGSTATGLTGTYLNNASEATTSTLNLKIIDLTPVPGNVVGNYANWLVTWNTHELKSVGTTGV